MCLIIHGPSNKIRSTLLNTPSLIDDIYQCNSDGLGIMYNTTSGVRVRKWLPGDVRAATKAVRSFPDDGRELAVHWRWRTHGDVNKENCHPYAVDGGFLMHNGVLNTGNRADPTKSDTWHYCRRFLDGGVMEKVAHEPAFLRLISEHIGEDNKFVMLTADGRMSIAGRQHGVEFEGLWFSNTYAWDPSALDPTWRDPLGHRGLYHTHRTHQDYSWVHGVRADDPAYQEFDEGDIDMWAELLEDSDQADIAQLLRMDAEEALSILFAQDWQVQPYRGSTEYPDLMKMVLDRDVPALVAECEKGREGILAEVLAWYTQWDFNPSQGQQAAVTPSQLRQPFLIGAETETETEGLTDAEVHWMNRALTHNEIYAG